MKKLFLIFVLLIGCNSEEYHIDMDCTINPYSVNESCVDNSSCIYKICDYGEFVGYGITEFNTCENGDNNRVDWIRTNRDSIDLSPSESLYIDFVNDYPEYGFYRSPMQRIY